MDRRMTLIAGILAALVTAAHGQILSATVDILSPGEPGYDGLPTNLVVVDYFVDVAETDVWTAAGTRVLSENGATLVYADGDANIPGVQPTPTDPGLDERYTTFISRPRGRDSDERFTNGAVGVPGGYVGAGAYLQPTEFDTAWYRSPPANSGTPGEDGYIARIAIDLGAAADRRDFLLVSQDAPPDGSIVYAQCPTALNSLPGWANVTFDHVALDGINWYLFDPVPEPGSIALLLGGAILVWRRRR